MHTCIVVGLGFFISREARDTASNGAGQISKLNAEFNESDKVMYDGLEVSGSEVINVINKYKNDEVGVIVVTKKSYSAYIYEIELKDSQYSLKNQISSSVKDAQNIMSNTYVNPNAQFMGEVIRDSNNAIIGLRFIQS